MGVTILLYVCIIILTVGLRPCELKPLTRELKKLILRQNVEVTLTGQKTYKRGVYIIKKEGMDPNPDIEITDNLSNGIQRQFLTT